MATTIYCKEDMFIQMYVCIQIKYQNHVSCQVTPKLVLYKLKFPTLNNPNKSNKVH